MGVGKGREECLGQKAEGGIEKLIRILVEKL